MRARLGAIKLIVAITFAIVLISIISTWGITSLGKNQTAGPFIYKIWTNPDIATTNQGGIPYRATKQIQIYNSSSDNKMYKNKHIGEAYVFLADKLTFRKTPISDYIGSETNVFSQKQITSALERLNSIESGDISHKKVSYPKGLSFNARGQVIFSPRDQVQVAMNSLEQNQPPEPKHNISIVYEPINPIPGNVIRFNTFQTKGNITNLIWDFGDGSQSQGPNVTHIFSRSGNYTIKIVSKDKNITFTTYARIKINEPPIAAFIFSPPMPKANDLVIFNASNSSDVDGRITNFEWDFGDGNTGKGIYSTHRYSRDSNFTVNLRIKDDNNATSMTSSKIVVNEQPSAHFAFMPLNPRVGDVVIFDASASNDADGRISVYEWDFGDGTRSKVKLPIASKVYSKNGTYTVILKLTDNLGAESSIPFRVTVNMNKPVINSFYARPAHIKKGENSMLIWNTSSSINAEISLAGKVEPNGSRKISPRKNTTYILIVSNAAGRVEKEVNIIVSNQTIAYNESPKAIIYYTPADPVVGDPISFEADQNINKNLNIIAYNWSFGDGTVGRWAIVEHAYSKKGNFTVNLTITDIKGARGYSSRNISLVEKSLPRINTFTADPTSIFSGESSNLTWNTSNATNITIYPEIGDVSKNRTTIISPEKTTTYILAAKNKYGVDIYPIRIEVLKQTGKLLAPDSRISEAVISPEVETFSKHSDSGFQPSNYPPEPPPEMSTSLNEKELLEILKQKFQGIISFDPTIPMVAHKGNLVESCIAQNNTEGYEILFETQKSDPNIVIKDIKITRNMSMSLEDPEHMFEIIDLTPTLQIIYPDRPTCWRWSVIPKEEGTFLLILSAQPDLRKNGASLPNVSWEIQKEKIKVIAKNETPMQRFSRTMNLAVIVGQNFYLMISGILLLLTSIFSLLILFRKWKKGKDDED